MLNTIIVLAAIAAIVALIVESVKYPPTDRE